jgi:hypothetical protein
LAGRLNLPRSSICRRLAAGQIRSNEVGNRHRIPYEECRQVWQDMADRLIDDSARDLEAQLFGE